MLAHFLLNTPDKSYLCLCYNPFSHSQKYGSDELNKFQLAVYIFNRRIINSPFELKRIQFEIGISLNFHL